MPDLTLILLGAGQSTRFNYKIKKQWIRVKDKPLWLYLVKNFQNLLKTDKIIIVADGSEIEYMKKYGDFMFVEGGKQRQHSLSNALKFVNTKYVLVTDIARPCIDKDVIDRLLDNKEEGDIVVPYLKVTDTVYYDKNYVDREKIKLIQTPQLSKTEVLKKALSTDKIYTDDSSAIIANGGKVIFIEGSVKAKKLTYFNDLKELDCLTPPENRYLSGLGYDVHPFQNGKKMYLGGVYIDAPYGCKAHSDGDVAIHALIDALLGAIGAGDIGELFPDSDNIYKDIDSKILLKEVVKFLEKTGYEIVNCDITIIAQKPKISPYKSDMQKSLSNMLNISKEQVNIKATTTEKLGFIGREEGIATQAIATLRFRDWSKDLDQ